MSDLHPEHRDRSDLELTNVLESALRYEFNIDSP
jgi:hypothetical protein